MEIYYVLGGCLAAWAVIVSFLGIVKEGFPATQGQERMVAVVSIALALATISAAALGGETEKPEGGEQAAASVPGR